MEYRVEDLRFYNMKQVPLHNYLDNSPMIFEIENGDFENGLSLVEKINFIDELEDGFATYMLKLHAQWEKDYESLPKQYGTRVKTVSFQGWLRRNDKRKIISTINLSDSLGSYSFHGTKFNIAQSIVLPEGIMRGYKRNEYVYAHKHIVHQWFHDLCKTLYNKEVEYVKEHDPYHVKLELVFSYGELYGHDFGEHKLSMLIWNHHMVDELGVTEADLDRYIKAYERVEALVTQIGDEWASEGIPMDRESD